LELFIKFELAKCQIENIYDDVYITEISLNIPVLMYFEFS